MRIRINCGYSRVMPNAYDRIRAELAQAEVAEPSESLPYLRAVLEETGRLLDEQLAKAVLDEQLSLRAAGAGAGLTENAVGPRLGRTAALGAYARADGRVTAEEVRRARYDKARGETPTEQKTGQPMRFKPRRST